jgi:spore maturation protein CgeB
MYALGAIGINLHIPVSLDLCSEVNERTFILACCGMFQLCDAPKALRRFFPGIAVPSAENPSEYADMFSYFLKDPEKRLPYQLASLTAVYEGNTIFHRMTRFLDHALFVIKSKRVPS